MIRTAHRDLEVGSRCGSFQRADSSRDNKERRHPEYRAFACQALRLNPLGGDPRLGSKKNNRYAERITKCAVASSVSAAVAGAVGEYCCSGR
jgi:hypothetical protein